MPSVAVTVRSMVESSGRDLAVLAGRSGLDRLVHWARVSEIHEPTAWLEGGELLLTTGIQLLADSEGIREDVRKIGEAEVTALGLATGDCLTHKEVPSALLAAAEEFGLPLVFVPEAVPLNAIIRAVAQALEEGRNEPMRRAFEAQRAPTASAIFPGGVAGIVGAKSAHSEGLARQNGVPRCQVVRLGQ